LLLLLLFFLLLLLLLFLSRLPWLPAWQAAEKLAEEGLGAAGPAFLQGDSAVLPGLEHVCCRWQWLASVVLLLSIACCYQEQRSA